jgi:L-alanine-DL-glutamate epimerase-like enolase superfamily enzyme
MVEPGLGGVVVKITGYRFAVHKETLAHPFRFKGGAFTEKWITVTSLHTSEGFAETGIGGLAVLWSDPEVFFSRSEAGGNLAMALIAEEAARLLVGTEVGLGTEAGSTETRSPLAIIPDLAGRLEGYARAVTGLSRVRKTFILNCLVSLDFALWKLLARERGTEDLSVEDLSALIPEDCRPGLREKHPRVARVPLVGYGMPPEKAAALADEGCFLLKIKLGPAGSQEEMLRADKDRLSALHEALKNKETPHTSAGRVLYYLDANGRYESEAALLRLLEHADSLGMLGRIALLEEPYPEDRNICVAKLPVRVAADESVHGPEDVALKADLGYRAFAVKPAGKTLSLSFMTIREAHRRELPCFVADSACVPLLVEWNKNIAARLPALPGLSSGILESNGEDHYARWKDLVAQHPAAGAPWISADRGFYPTGEEFFRCSGGIFRSCDTYEGLLPEYPGAERSERR